LKFAAEVFSQGRASELVAADWINRWEENNTAAMCELINFVIKCTGCNLQVDVHDIEDPDNVVGKLTDLQDEYQAQRPADYPLISRAKANSSFRSTMTGFFETLIMTCHAAGLLYSDLAIIENIEVWISTMSSSGMRPFRHTATIVSLTIGTTLCRVAADIAENTAKTMRQKDSEQKKKSVNKGRVKELDTKIADLERKRTQVKESLQAVFDTVFIHRYRDADPKIRVDCVTALGTWIITLPDVFFEGIYLRYLAWVLSDTFAPTRAEVIKQLSKLYKNKDNVARLRTFTERFRSRLVEMALRDSEVSIRASTIELLDLIRQTGLLEPDDIDNVGRLIFDSEPRVRKAVAGFFAENINDLFETTLEDFGGEEGLAEVLGEEVEEDYDSPRISWLKLKCVAEALQSYDAEDEDDSANQNTAPGLLATGAESRYALAAQTIYDGIPEAKEWEVIAGYLLCDLSSADQAGTEADAAFKERCKLSEKEELLLLEILNVSAKSRLSEAISAETDKRGKKTKIRKDESREIQESAALHLAQIIPQLLKKSGSNSATVSAVLRLEHVLNLEIFQDLRQHSTTYASLLDDINKQFLTHADQGVLIEASTALLHARSYEDLEEVTESKVQELWDDTINALRSSIVGADIATDVCDTVRRIANLASVVDCVAVLDGNGQGQETQSPYGILIELLQDPPGATEGLDFEIMTNVMKALLFYHMWIARSLQESLKGAGPPRNLPEHTSFTKMLVLVMKNHTASNLVRVAATGILLDLYTLFATFRHIASYQGYTFPSIALDDQPLILATFAALEKTYAKKSRRRIEIAVDEDVASDPQDSDEEEEEHSVQETLTAEKRLCELTGKMVLAIVARVLDQDGPNKGALQTRITANRAKLGPNFREVLAYLDGPKAKGKKKRAPAGKKPGAKKTGVKKSRPTVQDESDDNDEEAAREEGGEEDLRARELVEDRIVDPEDDEGVEAGSGEDEGEDEIMGD